MTRYSTIAAAVMAAALSARPATAGSQLLCRTYDIGSEASLPWTPNPHWGRPNADYPRQQLVEDTLKLLTPDRPVIVRMETLRRAVEYAGKSELARELVARLMARVLEAESEQAPHAPLAWFDVGYLVATYELSGGAPLAGLDGYGWVVKALAHRADPDMHFAAALIRRESPDQPGPHLRRAYEGAAPGSLLARNLTLQFGPRKPATAAAR